MAGIFAFCKKRNMQITEGLIERIARKVFAAMFPSALRQSNVVTTGSGSVQYAAEAGHAQTADSATSAGSANEVPWSGVQSKPDTATRWPTWNEVSSKPNFASVATSGNYNDLSNKPSIPTVPTNVSAFNNDAGYITSSGSCAYATSAGSATSASYASDLKAGSSVEIWIASVKKAYFDGNGTLVLLNSNDSAGTSWNAPALCIGGEASAAHIEIDSNEIMAKSNASTTTKLYLNAEGGDVVINETSGNCGIGVANPQYKLHVAGTIYTTGGIGDLSDIRKKDVETYKWAPSLDMIADAPIIRYSMKDDKTHRMRVGSVAQYWEKVMPETVNQDDEGILSILTGDITLPSVIALAREVRKLKEEIAQLRQNGIQ